MITPNEIESKEFGSQVRGYNREDVDEFLDEIMIDYQGLIDENKKLRRDVETLNKELNDYKKSETSVMSTLEQAKSLMSDISSSAEKRAEIIIKNAQVDAAAITRDAKESISRLTQESEQLKSRVASFKERYRQMLTDELNKVDSSADDLFADLKDDFYPASMVDKNDAKDDELDKLFDDERRTSELDLGADLEREDNGGKMTDDVTLTEKVLSELNGADFDDKAKTVVIDDVDGLLNKKTRIIK